MKKDNNKIKKIGAWIAIIILLLACCMPMIFAFGNGEDSQVYFKASLAVAIMVPIMAYAIWMVYKLLNRNKKVVDSDMENIIFDVGQVLVNMTGRPIWTVLVFRRKSVIKLRKWYFRAIPGMRETEAARLSNIM